MQLSDFNFTLPDNLIARYPTPKRSDCRLLSLDGSSGQIEHGKFTDIFDKVESGDLLIFNNTRVIPARIYGQKSTGGKIEVLIERLLDNHRVLAHIKASKSPKSGSLLLLGDTLSEKATMIARHDTLFELQFTDDVLVILNKIGHIPLPPYIDRPDNEADKELYQTVYNKKPGAVAAPTAGLHFDKELIEKLKQKGVHIAFITLHVGAGTFQPVRVDNITSHSMHAEYAEVPQSVIEAIQNCKSSGKRVIAVGTTSVRAIESAAQQSDILAPFFNDTRIFIYPGYEFKIIDCLITNFHLPESTLIMLVSAFAGHQNTMNAYQEAVKKQYRFFSYGDAMFITR